MHVKVHDQMWLKKVLIPSWTIELVICTITVILATIDLATWEQVWGGFNWTIGSVFWLPFAAFTGIVDVTAIILYSKHNLEPKTYLGFNCSTAAIWIAMFALDVYVNIVSYNQGGIEFAISATLLLTTVGQLAYASVIEHRRRKGVFDKIREYTIETPPRGSYAGYHPEITLNASSKASSRIPARESYPSAGPSSPRLADPPPAYDPAEDGQRAARPSSMNKGDVSLNSTEAAEYSYELQGVGYRGQPGGFL